MTIVVVTSFMKPCQNDHYFEEFFGVMHFTRYLTGRPIIKLYVYAYAYTRCSPDENIRGERTHM